MPVGAYGVGFKSYKASDANPPGSRSGDLLVLRNQSVVLQLSWLHC